MSGVGLATMRRAETLVAEADDYARAIEKLAQVLDVPAAAVDDVLDRAEVKP